MASTNVPELTWYREGNGIIHPVSENTKERRARFAQKALSATGAHGNVAACSRQKLVARGWRYAKAGKPEENIPEPAWDQPYAASNDHVAPMEIQRKK